MVLSIGIVECQTINFLSCSRIEARPQFDHVSVGVAHKYLDMPITEGHRTLCNRNTALF